MVAYVPGPWHNLPQTDTPISAERLTAMEQGIATAQQTADGAAAGGASAAAIAALQNTIDTLQATVSQLQTDASGYLIVWNTRVGGVVTGAIVTDATGVYPPHPASTKALLFNNPLVQPSFDGLQTGGGGMAPGDFWLAGGAGVSTV